MGIGFLVVVTAVLPRHHTGSMSIGCRRIFTEARVADIRKVSSRNSSKAEVVGADAGNLEHWIHGPAGGDASQCIEQVHTNNGIDSRITSMMVMYARYSHRQLVS